MRTQAPRLVCLLIAGAIASPSAQQPATGSVARVRAALEKPAPRLMLTDRKPDFTLRIEARHPLHEVFESPPWALPHVGWRPPPVGFDLLSVVRSVAKSVADAKRGHDEHLARDEVQRAIEDYCSAQPNAGADLQICAIAPR